MLKPNPYDNLWRNNVTTFLDTQERAKEDPGLAESLRRSLEGQYLAPDGSVELKDMSGEKEYKAENVIVSEKRCLEAARAYGGKRVCVLSFANAFHPGGGVKSGSQGQEEQLCRISTLYPCITSKAMTDGYYRSHYARELDYLSNGDCIFTPGVTVLKTDEQDPVLLEEKDRYEVDVVTCAAPDLSGLPRLKPAAEKLMKIYVTRIATVLELAKKEGAQVMLLGAWGCGNFRNDPRLAAEAFRKVLAHYAEDFEAIEFAIYCRSMEEENLQVFREILEDK